MSEYEEEGRTARKRPIHRPPRTERVAGVHELPSSVEVATIETGKVTGWISIAEAAIWLGMGKRFVEELVAKREVTVRKFGSRTRILFSSLQQWAARQPDCED
jgi:excisionase family DNA binding protein